jgi:hypothetical protein
MLEYPTVPSTPGAEPVYVRLKLATQYESLGVEAGPVLHTPISFWLAGVPVSAKAPE